MCFFFFSFFFVKRINKNVFVKNFSTHLFLWNSTLGFKRISVSVYSFSATGFLWTVQPLSKRSVGFSAAVFPQKAGGLMVLQTWWQSTVLIVRKDTKMWRCFQLFFCFCTWVKDMLFKLCQMYKKERSLVYLCIYFDFLKVILLFKRNLHKMSYLYISVRTCTQLLHLTSK